MQASLVVSGGTGGLGSAVTQVLLEAGWHVVVPYVDERELERVEPHPQLELVKADLFDAAAAAGVVKQAPAPLRGLVNLVGGDGSMNVPNWSPDSKSLAFVSYQMLPVEDTGSTE